MTESIRQGSEASSSYGSGCPAADGAGRTKPAGKSDDGKCADGRAEELACGKLGEVGETIIDNSITIKDVIKRRQRIFR